MYLLSFLYHEVNDNPSEFHKKFNLSISKKTFFNQLIFIKNNYNIINPKDLLTDKLEKNSALITFDDGCKGIFTNAIPILNELNIPAMIFLNCDAINNDINLMGLIFYLLYKDKRILKYFPNSNFRNLNLDKINIFLDKEDENHLLKNAKKYHGHWASINDLKNLDDNSEIYFGNHLYNHLSVLNISENELKKQFFNNESFLKQFNNTLPFFSYPFGQIDLDYNDYSNNIINKLGAKIIFSANAINFNHTHKVLNRLPMYESVNNITNLKIHIVNETLKTNMRKIIRKFFFVSM